MWYDQSVSKSGCYYNDRRECCQYAVFDSREFHSISWGNKLMILFRLYSHDHRLLLRTWSYADQNAGYRVGIPCTWYIYVYQCYQLVIIDTSFVIWTHQLSAIKQEFARRSLRYELVLILNTIDQIYTHSQHIKTYLNCFICAMWIYNGLIWSHHDNDNLR